MKMSPLPTEVDAFLDAHDFSPHTSKAIKCDLAKFIRWFTAANGERFDLQRVTVRDVADFKEHLHSIRRQAIATVNRALVSVRRFLAYLVKSGALPANPADAVKELRRMPTVPKGLTTAQVRKILREVELRQDRRSAAILGLMLYGGLRVSDVVGLELTDLELAPRSGQATCRHGKGNKQRIVPLPHEARRALTDYLECRPPTDSQIVFIGERGPLTGDGVRAICFRYAARTGVKFTPHTLRHTFAHRFLATTNNDIVALAQILGHENLNTTSIYTKRGQDELAARVEGLRYDASESV
jgi:site-specific recombinase XerD